MVKISSHGKFFDMKIPDEEIKKITEMKEEERQQVYFEEADLGIGTG